jgi:carbon storage regulator
MRIFTRQPSQSLLIGDHISVTVVEIRGAQVRIGFKAPSDTRIQRQEVIGKTDRTPLQGGTDQ